MKKKEIWFKAKKYGYGWTPSTWEGWFAILLYVIALSIGEAFYVKILLVDSGLIPNIGFAVFVAAITIALVRLCIEHGEPPAWRWGRK